MLLAAGLGKRLGPLTDQTPKALIPVNGTPLLEIAIGYLARFGFDEIIINVHHHAGLLKDFLESKRFFGLHIEISDETDRLLDTGGGLKKAAWFFDQSEPFLVYNVDILSDLNLRDFYQAHIKSDALATLAVRNRPTQRFLLFDADNFLCGWQNVKTGKTISARPATSTLRQLAFSGIHVLSPAILKHFPLEDVFSLIDLYLRLAPDYPIKCYRHNASRWLDVGKPENLAEAGEFLAAY